MSEPKKYRRRLLLVMVGVKTHNKQVTQKKREFQKKHKGAVGIVVEPDEPNRVRFYVVYKEEE